jgi:hypothetical protein
LNDQPMAFRTASRVGTTGGAHTVRVMDMRINRGSSMAGGATRPRSVLAGMARRVLRLGVAAATFGTGAVQGQAQTPRAAPSGLLAAGQRVRPSAIRATTADFRWMEGTWQGRLTSGSGILTVVFAKPDAGLLTGVMHLVDNEKILVVELISLVDTPDGPELRFRHFSSTLDAYESTFKQTLRLTAHDASRDVFENLVPFDKSVMSTMPRTTTFSRHGADEFVGRTDTIEMDGKPGVVEVTYHRVP